MLKKWNNNRMLELANKQTQNSMIIIIAIMVNLRYSFNGWELLWYSLKRYWKLLYQGLIT
jgi:hypothetical protein